MRKQIMGVQINMNIDTERLIFPAFPNTLYVLPLDLNNAPCKIAINVSLLALRSEERRVGKEC